MRSMPCGAAASLAAVWNFLYSTAGCGSLPPVAHGAARDALGAVVEGGERDALVRAFHHLNQEARCMGESLELRGPWSEDELTTLLEGLSSSSIAYILCVADGRFLVPLGGASAPDGGPWLAVAEPGSIEDFARTTCHNVMNAPPPPVLFEKWAEITGAVAGKMHQCEQPCCRSRSHAPPGGRRSPYFSTARRPASKGPTYRKCFACAAALASQSTRGAETCHVCGAARPGRKQGAASNRKLASKAQASVLAFSTHAPQGLAALATLSRQPSQHSPL